MSDILYIKADKNVEVTKPDVTLGDIFEMECKNETILPKLKVQRLLKFTENPKKAKKGRCRTVVSVLHAISCIHEVIPSLEVQNIGETDIIVTYEDQKTAGPILHWLKVVAVVIITFVGSAFSIMSFNNDVDAPKLFAQIYELITGKPSNGFTILEFTYSIGLIIGILVFFNHFGKKRFSVDPTPIEVEMRLYENDIQTTLVETYSRKGKEVNVDATDYVGSYRD